MFNQQASLASQISDNAVVAKDHTQPAPRPELHLVQMEAGFAQLPFSSAAELWMELRRNRSHLKPLTHDANAGYIVALNKFFGTRRLCDITADDIYAYQLARTSNTVQIGGGHVTHPWKLAAGHSCINHEISCLGQVLNHCNLWKRLRPYYFPLSTPKWSPR